ncbi:MAG: methionine--tRNA ligase [Acidaminococcales bacterium]|jgi:methionyl-tRNA synthetase|nr:methionine--tRNA ligase [Acidaminococcales bacterium]
MDKEKFYITTPIYYPSDKLHIGHAYCTTVADCIARYNRFAGRDVLFVTGSDEHGQKIQRKAAENKTTPLEYVTEIVKNFKLLWEKLGISYDDFIRTSERRQTQTVQYFFQKLHDKGDIYKSEYEGLYCVQCEAFWLERQLSGGNCPDCGRPVEKMKEESYFFRMSAYTEKWFKFIEENPDFIQPVSRRNEMINFVKQGLDDLSVSRSTFDWGVPVPFDPKHTIYVWFDAVINYITAAGMFEDMDKYRKYWPADLHLVGKEIVRFHSIIWPIMLMAMDLPLPGKIYGHGWLVIEGDKMSKSKGNVVDPLLLIEEFGADAIRYFLLREVTLGADGNFSRDALINRINSDLANDLGNLLHRTLGMIERFNKGIVRKGEEITPLEEELVALADRTLDDFERFMENMEINEALKAVWSLIARSNKYIDETCPWLLAKDPARAGRLDTVLYRLVEILRVVAFLVSPFLPFAAPEILRQLGLSVPTEFLLKDARLRDTTASGSKMAGGTPIFPRIDPPAADAGADIAVPGSAPEEEITIDEFNKMRLKVARVLAAEKVEKTDKLLKLKLDVAGEERVVVSGIALHYAPEELVGKDVVIVANLKPAKLRGIKSRGMILAASDDKGRLAIIEAPGVKSGSRVK